MQREGASVSPGQHAVIQTTLEQTYGVHRGTPSRGTPAGAAGPERLGGKIYCNTDQLITRTNR